MQVLALSGSLRQASINTAFCRAAARLASAPMRVEVYADLRALPLFNPDLEAAPPAAVLDLRAAVARADALLIASPEYAHGVSGAMKNALDWLVSDPSVVGKPFALVNTSPRAHHAYEALGEVLRTMSLARVADASVAVQLLGSCITEAAMLESAQASGAIRAVLSALAAHLAGQRSGGASFPID